MSGVTATVFGCSGFVGRYVSQSLGNVGTQLVLPYRCDALDIQHLRTMGDLGQVVPLPGFNIRDDDAIKRAIAQSSLIINMVGTDAETWNYTFEDVHVDFPARLARLAKEAGCVERVVHFSCLGAAADAPSRRLRTKAAGEEIIRSELGAAATVFKPAAVTGTEDRLFNTFAGWIKTLPAVPLLGGGTQRLQPVWVRDVAQAVMNALHTWDSMGKTYHLAGPDVFTVEQLVRFTYDTVREEPTIVPVPAALAAALAVPGDWVARRTPFRGPPQFTADAVSELGASFLPPAGPGVLTFADLDIEPRRVTEGVPIEYLRHYRSGGACCVAGRRVGWLSLQSAGRLPRCHSCVAATAALFLATDLAAPRVVQVTISAPPPPTLRLAAAAASALPTGSMCDEKTRFSVFCCTLCNVLRALSEEEKEAGGSGHSLRPLRQPRRTPKHNGFTCVRLMRAEGI